MSESLSSERKLESTSKDTERHVDPGAPVSSNTRSNQTSSVQSSRNLSDYNPSYLMQLRGILNIITLVLNMSTVILISLACQITSNGKIYLDFSCQAPETFLFVVSCSSTIHAALIILWCLLSNKANQMLYDTSYELSYYLLYFALYLASDVILLVILLNRKKGDIDVEYRYGIKLAGAIIGLINCFFYGASAAWFFILHL